MKIGIIGAGAMGSGIAQVAATAGHEVILVDAIPEALDRASAKLQKILNRLVEKGRISNQEAVAIFGRIYFTANMETCSECGLVIEAIVEDLEIKKNIFRTLEEFVEQGVILATNTSSLSVAAIAAACKDPSRVIGIHFFNPAPLMKLVEIIPAIQTAQTTVTKARELIDHWGKHTVLTRDTPGFIVNRIARPFYGEALRIYEEGYADPATIDWAVTEIGGFRMGPFALMDFIGNDVNYKVTESVFAAFFYDPRYKPSFIQKRMAEAGYLGRKTGKGYYEYGEGVSFPEPTRDKENGDKIFWRILVMLINEAADALYLQIASKEDIETAMTLGVNYPKGLLAWADEKGIKHCVEAMDKLYDEYHEDRYRCSPLLRRMAKEGMTFL